MTDALAPVSATASATVSKTGTPSKFVPLTRRHSTHDLGHVLKHLLGVERALSARDALNDNFSIFIY